MTLSSTVSLFKPIKDLALPVDSIYFEDDLILLNLVDGFKEL
jgi:hypothetical protein